MNINPNTDCNATMNNENTTTNATSKRFINNTPVTINNTSNSILNRNISIDINSELAIIYNEIVPQANINGSSETIKQLLPTLNYQQSIDFITGSMEQGSPLLAASSSENKLLFQQYIKILNLKGKPKADFNWLANLATDKVLFNKIFIAIIEEINDISELQQFVDNFIAISTKNNNQISTFTLTKCIINATLSGNYNKVVYLSALIETIADFDYKSAAEEYLRIVDINKNVRITTLLLNKQFFPKSIDVFKKCDSPALIINFFQNGYRPMKKPDCNLYTTEDDCLGIYLNDLIIANKNNAAIALILVAYPKLSQYYPATYYIPQKIYNNYARPLPALLRAIYSNNTELVSMLIALGERSYSIDDINLLKDYYTVGIKSDILRNPLTLAKVSSLELINLFKKNGFNLEQYKEMIYLPLPILPNNN